MAFPTIEAADTKTGTVTSNSTSWTLTYPTNIASGDLLLLFLASDGAGANTTTGLPANWNSWVNNEGAVSLLVAGKIATGSETGNFTFTAAANEQGSWRIFRITGFYGGTLPASTNSIDFSQGDGLEVSNGPRTITASPGTAGYTPAWGSDDNLWFHTVAVDTSRTISVYPLASNNTADVSGGANGATLGLCSTNTTTVPLADGIFTISASDDTAPALVVVRPGAPAAPVILSQGFVNFNDPGIL